MTSLEQTISEMGHALETLRALAAKLATKKDDPPNSEDLKIWSNAESLWRRLPELRQPFGQRLTAAVAAERATGARSVIARLAGTELARLAEKHNPLILVLNTRLLGTWVTLLRGLNIEDQVFLHNPGDRPDNAQWRAESVADWLRRHIETHPEWALSAVACRGGFLGPVTCGTYLATETMWSDMAHAPISHHSNLALAIVQRLRDSGLVEQDIPVAVTDPVACDELDDVERLTGFAPLLRDGTGAHYLNHRGCHHLLSSFLMRDPAQLTSVTIHLGAGTSVALHRGGLVRRLVDSFSGIPSANRSGALEIGPVLQSLKKGDFDLKELDEAVFRSGGLMSLAGTDDFEAFLGFRQAGATSGQAKKIDAFVDMVARRAAASVGALTAGLDPDPPVLVVTGPLVRSPMFRSRLLKEFGTAFPVVVMPGSVENEALAAGALRALFHPATCKDYPQERSEVARRRDAVRRMWETTIFERPLRYRVPGAPVTGIDELIDSAYMAVRGMRLPTMAIVGAANEAAILAARYANERGRYRLARFLLVDDYESVSSLAYDFDLVVDGQNYAIEDTEDPVAEAVRLLDEGRVDILMKGRLKTEEILRGVFSYLKRSGRLKKGQVVSHVVTIDIPTRSKLVLITDAAVNPYPDEKRKIAILENALTVASSLHIPTPKVAVLSAIESVNPSVDSSLEARRIAERMAHRTDCLVEGPLSFDVAMDADVAAEKGYKGRIQGDADILLMPDIDAGNVVYKALTTQSGATVAGIILCGDMPMVLTSRGDSARSKLASIAQAVKLWHELSLAQP